MVSVIRLIIKKHNNESNSITILYIILSYKRIDYLLSSSILF